MLQTDFHNGVLDKNVNPKRMYSLISTDETVFFEGYIEDISEYVIPPDAYGAIEINETNQAVNDIAPEAGDDIQV